MTIKELQKQLSEYEEELGSETEILTQPLDDFADVYLTPVTELLKVTYNKRIALVISE